MINAIKKIHNTVVDYLVAWAELRAKTKQIHFWY
jgi:hypothetical protein